ncbi:MAG: lipopolysaccharide kinase InaA family protein [Planctomycetota bacterium]|jgi:3-deoxy-D-manno-octulosonic acid kinase
MPHDTPQPPADCRVVARDGTTAWVRHGYDDFFLSHETLLGRDGFRSAQDLDVAAAERGGRGASPTLAVPGRPERLIWRHYRRGGVLAPLLKDGFRDPGRPMREWVLSDALRAANVRTPLVVAAMVHEGGSGWFTGDFCTVEIPGAEDLGVFLERTAALPAAERARERNDAARAVADTLHAMHAAGAVHRDLNCANVMVRRDDAGAMESWVIDLDKSPPIGAPLDGRTRASQLLRLARSAAKLRAAGIAVGWRDAARLFHRYAAHYPGVREHMTETTGRGERLVHGIGWWIGRRLGLSKR